MLGNAIKQTTTTTGSAGENLTLSAVTGSPTFANVFSLKQAFSYTLLNASGGFVEAGIGYLLNSTTLVRHTITATFDGTTYDNTDPAPATLAGTTTVLCTPHAATSFGSYMTVDSVSSGVSRYITSAARTMSTSTSTAPNTRIYYLPFLITTGVTVTSLAINVTTLQAGAWARGGLYSCVDGYPLEKIAETAQLAADTTGLKSTTLASPIFLPAGWYYTGFTNSGGTSAYTCYTSGQQYMMGNSILGLSSTGVIEIRYEGSGTPFTALPATVTATTTSLNSGAAHPPLVYLGIL